MKKYYRVERTNDAGSKFWEAVVEDSTAVYRWGTVGSSKIQSKIKKFKASKGSSSSDAAVTSTERKIRAKLDDDYVITKGKLSMNILSSKSAVAADLTVPKVMLAQKLKPSLRPLPPIIQAASNVIVQPKIDGNRGLVNIITGEIFSRKRKKIHSLPGLGKQIKKDCTRLRQQGIEWVDGEFFSPDMSFDDIQSVMRTKNMPSAEEARKIKYNIFDYISNEGVEDRVENINKFVRPSDTTKIVESQIIRPAEIERYHDKYVQDGHEGAMVRIIGSPYDSKRSKYLWKFKKFFDYEFRIVGFAPEKNDPDKLGAFIMKMKTGDTFKARPAATEKEKASMWKEKEKFLNRKATVKLQGYTSKGKPRFGVIKYIFPK